MNARINQLIKQCTVQEFSDCTGGYETFDQEKFAELIVRECVSVGRTAFLNDHSTVPVFPAEKIKEHFGVAE